MRYASMSTMPYGVRRNTLPCKPADYMPTMREGPSTAPSSSSYNNLTSNPSGESGLLPLPIPLPLPSGGPRDLRPHTSSSHQGGPSGMSVHSSASSSTLLRPTPLRFGSGFVKDQRDDPLLRLSPTRKTLRCSKLIQPFQHLPHRAPPDHGRATRPPHIEPLQTYTPVKSRFRDHTVKSLPLLVRRNRTTASPRVFPRHRLLALGPPFSLLPSDLCLPYSRRKKLISLLCRMCTVMEATRPTAACH